MEIWSHALQTASACLSLETGPGSPLGSAWTLLALLHSLCWHSLPLQGPGPPSTLHRQSKSHIPHSSGIPAGCAACLEQADQGPRTLPWRYNERSVLACHILPQE